MTDISNHLSVSIPEARRAALTPKRKPERRARSRREDLRALARWEDDGGYIPRTK